MGLSMLLFYEVTYGFLMGSVIGVFKGMYLVRLGLRYRLLWVWVFGWRRGWCMVRKWKWYMLTFSGVYRASDRD